MSTWDYKVGKKVLQNFQVRTGLKKYRNKAEMKKLKKSTLHLVG